MRRRSLHLVPAAALSFLFSSPLAVAAGSPTVVQAEVAHLLAHLQRSGCQFSRNGTWYSGAEAVAHLEKKYAYLRKKGWVDSTEDFVVRAATKSSISGKPYQVRCGKRAAVSSADWLKDELERYRSAPP